MIWPISGAFLISPDSENSLNCEWQVGTNVGTIVPTLVHSCHSWLGSYALHLKTVTYEIQYIVSFGATSVNKAFKK